MKTKSILIFCLTALLCVSVSACQKKVDKTPTGDDLKKPVDNVSEQTSPSDIKALSDSAVELMTNSIPKYSEDYPTLKDAAALYEKANMVIGWIIGTEEVAVYDDDSITVDGLIYKRVRPDCFYGAHNLEHHAEEIGETQKLIYDLKSLEAYIGTIINPEEAKEYMADSKELKKFTEGENGGLYVLPFYYEPTGFGEEKYSLDANDDGTYTFNVDYELIDENGEAYKERRESFDLVQLDGRWVFEDFRVIRQN